MSNPLKDWWTRATPEQKRKMADEVGTTVATLHQMAGAYRTKGQVSVSPLMAAKIERASGGAIKREQLCRACGQCELAEIARNTDA